MRTKAASFAASVMCFTGFDQCWNLQGILDVAIHLSLPSISPEYRKINERKGKKKGIVKTQNKSILYKENKDT